MATSETERSAQPTDQGAGKSAGKSAKALALGITIAVLFVVAWLLGWYFGLGGRWIHVLPLIAAAIAIELFIRFYPQRDIKTEDAVIPQWNAANVSGSLTEIHSYVIREAGKSNQWYWRAKRSKAVYSQLIRFSALVLAAVAGLLPIAGSLAKDYGVKLSPDPSNGLWASGLLGLAAALVGLDKAFGFSSGWARYVLTATNIRKTLEEFRMEWAELMAKLGTSPTAESGGPLIDRARKFRSDVEALVLQETKDWVTEFQNSMVQMEKDIGAQLAALKAQVDKTAQAKVAAGQPGAIQLQIENASKADPGSKIKVTLTDGDGPPTEEMVSGQTWAKLNLSPAHYKLKIQATVKEQTVEDQKVVPVKPGEIANVQMAL